MLVAAYGIELRQHALVFFLLSVGLSDLYTRKSLIKAFENVKKTLSACINHACFFEYGKHFRSLFEDLFSFCDKCGEESKERRIFICYRLGVLRHISYNGEYRALFRLCHGTVSYVSRAVQSNGKRLGGDRLLVAQNPCQTFYYLR